MKAIITVGISASGKSTWADEFCKTQDNWFNINRDDTRFKLFTNGDRDWNKYKFSKQNENKELEFKYIKPVTLVKDHEQQYLEVCGKKYIYTWGIDQLISAMEHEINRYGKRSNDGIDKGMDAKSLSHALRVLCELEEILTTNTISFPLKDREWLLKVKLNQVPYEDVMNEIDSRYDKCMSLLETCNLPEHNDLTSMYKVVEDYYFS